MVQLRATDLAGNVGTAQGELEVLKAPAQAPLTPEAGRTIARWPPPRRARGSSRPSPDNHVGDGSLHGSTRDASSMHAAAGVPA